MGLGGTEERFDVGLGWGRAEKRDDVFETAPLDFFESSLGVWIRDEEEASGLGLGREEKSKDEVWEMEMEVGSGSALRIGGGCGCG